MAGFIEERGSAVLAVRLATADGALIVKAHWGNEKTARAQNHGETRMRNNAGLIAWFGMTALMLVTSISGCVSMGFKYDESALKKQVAFETSCPVENIELIEAMEAGTGHTKFKLKVCGEEQKWNRFGTSYFAEGKSPMGQ